MQKPTMDILALFPMPPTLCDSDDLTSLQPDCVGHARDDGTGDDAGPLPLGRNGREQSSTPKPRHRYAWLRRLGLDTCFPGASASCSKRSSAAQSFDHR